MSVLDCIFISVQLSKISYFYCSSSPVKVGGRIQLLPDGELRITSVQHSDAGNYTCSVENTRGRDFITYYVNVEGKSQSKITENPVPFKFLR